MANIQHRDMVSADVHEPKHISDSTSADAGKVITPSTGGLSELRYLTPSEVGVNFIYGEAALDANTATTAVSAATDASLYTTSDYVQLNSNAGRLPGVYLDHANAVTFNSTTNGLIIPVSGDYRVYFWMNIKSDTNNSKIGIKAKENGSWCNFTVKHDIAALDRVQLISGSIITDMVAGNEMTLWLASDKAASLTIQDMRFYVELLKES